MNICISYNVERLSLPSAWKILLFQDLFSVFSKKCLTFYLFMGFVFSWKKKCSFNNDFSRQAGPPHLQNCCNTIFLMSFGLMGLKGKFSKCQEQEKFLILIKKKCKKFLKKCKYSAKKKYICISVLYGWDSCVFSTGSRSQCLISGKTMLILKANI